MKHLTIYEYYFSRGYDYKEHSPIVPELEDRPFKNFIILDYKAKKVHYTILLKIVWYDWVKNYNQGANKDKFYLKVLYYHKNGTSIKKYKTFYLDKNEILSKLSYQTDSYKDAVSIYKNRYDIKDDINKFEDD